MSHHRPRKRAVELTLSRALRLLFVIVLSWSYLADIPVVDFQEDSAIAQSKKKRKRRRRRKVRESKSEETKDPGKPFAVVGGDEKVDHAAFDADQSAKSGLDVVLVLDSSRSMQRTDPGRLRDQGAKLLVRFLAEGDRIAILHFDEKTTVDLPMTEVGAETLSKTDSVITAIPNEGNFTDLWSPINSAFELLKKDGRANADKAVVLLSDGKMDPHPNAGDKQALLMRLLETDLPAFKKKKIKLYTLSLSSEADQDLLRLMAQKTGGLHWFAPDVNTVHKIFSDLFLTLKQPQVVALEGSGFEIDGTTTEATFYLSRTDPKQQVSIIDPQGNSFNNVNFPSNVKWYRGTLFDVVTIKNPLPGVWGVDGLDNPEGFATLLSDLKVQVRWPQLVLRKGDSMTFMVRLTDKGKPVDDANMKDITFYTYKIIESRSGKLMNRAALNDKGEDGDQEAGDGIYSATIKFDDEGEYKALISVAGPTFTRQQYISFNVSTGTLALVVEPPNEFTGKAGALKVVLGKEIAELDKKKVMLVAEQAGAEKAVGLSLDAYLQDDGTYLVPDSLLPTGTYKIHARFEGIEGKKNKVEAASETIEYAFKSIPGETSPGEVSMLAAQEEEASEYDLIFGISSTVISLLVTLGAGYFFLRKAGKDGGVSIVDRKKYSIPEEIEQAIEAVKERASSERRAPSELELELFHLVKDKLVAIPVTEGQGIPDEGAEGEGDEAGEGAEEGAEGDAASEEGAEEEKADGA